MESIFCACLIKPSGTVQLYFQKNSIHSFGVEEYIGPSSMRKIWVKDILLIFLLQDFAL